MNPVALTHLVAAFLVVLLSIPLIRRKVGRNDWYGVRIPAAFASEEAWFDVNHYGGRLLLIWGAGMGVTAMVGLFLPRRNWPAYNWTALVIILGGLFLLMAQIQRYARNRKQG